MKYVAVGDTVYFEFPTQTLAAAKATLSGTPVISAYKDDSLVQTTAGITLTVDHDGITGCNVVKVDTSADGTFYSSGAQIRLRITTGTVDSVDVAGDPVGEFTMGIANANVSSMNTDSISAAAVSAAAVTKIQSGLATSGALTTVAGYLDTEIAAILEDTGTTLPAQIAAIEDGIIISASSSVLDTIDDGGNITLRRGDRVSFSLTLGNVTGRTGEKLFFTIKRQNTNDTDDSNAIVQITETTGAVLVNGSSTGVTAADASIVVSNETTGVTVFVIQDSITTLFPVGSGWHYDVQMIRSDGKAVTLTYGSVTIVADTTRRKTI